MRVLKLRNLLKFLILKITHPKTEYANLNYHQPTESTQVFVLCGGGGGGHCEEAHRSRVPQDGAPSPKLDLDQPRKKAETVDLSGKM